MMTSTLTMTSGRNSLQRRLTNLAGCNRSISIGNSGSPLLNASDNEKDLDPLLKHEQHASDDESNNNRTASDYLSKLLNSRDLSNDLDNSLPTLAPSDSGNFSYVPMKSSSTPNTRSSSSQHKSTTQKRTNRTSNSNRQKPAEVFRKDLISAMKIPDNSQFLREEYWIMQDPWKIEWEKGVQVPVNQKAIPTREVHQLSKQTVRDFQLSRKMIKSSPEADDREMIDFNVLADSTCRYDLDDIDVFWLELVNKERKKLGLKPLDESTIEKIMEELEIQCHESMQTAIKTKEGLGIEYDENVVCDVCQVRDCEEGNEMVFCDGCNLCVHQACYGIVKIPEGSWLCKPCALGIRNSAVCILCEKKGGAMKSTRSGNKWAHVSCAMWIPEIRFGDAERMEPITKVSLVPASRWALLCFICKNRVGACIQCSVKNCVTAYHVTCAIESKLDMIADDDSDDDSPVVLRSYCKKHSNKRKDSDAEDEQSEEEKRSQRQHRIMELEEGFHTFVKPSAIASNLSIPQEAVDQVLVYWKLKRKVNFNRALITPKNEEDTALAEAAETNLQKRLRMFTHLRQDLERVRNLCYMIGRREKTKRASVKNMESVFLTQMKVLERRMCDKANYDSTRMVPFLEKFGKANICKLARKESLRLAKTSEWSQSVDDSDQDRSESPSRDVEENADAKKQSQSIGVVTEKEAIVDDSSVTATKSLDPELAADKLKNGVHRKAFASACQKRESLIKSERRKSSSNDQTSVTRDSSLVESARKRSHRSNTDDNTLSLGKSAKKRSRLAKSHSLLSWRTSQASPSSYTVKTNDTLSRDSDNELPSVKNRIGARRTRSFSVVSDEPSVKSNEKQEKRDEPVLSRTEKHLIVTWDSDKNDDPDILEKSTVGDRKLSLKSDQKADKTRKSDSVFDSIRPEAVLSQKSKSPSVDDKSTSDDNKPSVARSSLRTAAREAKNASGALALSCESGSLRNRKTSLSSEQELRTHHLHSPPSVVHRSSSRASSKDASRTLLKRRSFSKQEEDGGYGGDMESDSDAPSALRQKNVHSHHRAHEKGSSKSTDTSESFLVADRYSSSRKRRLKGSRFRGEKKAMLVSFQGFQDIDGGASRRPSSDKSTVEIPSSSDQVPAPDNLNQQEQIPEAKSPEDVTETVKVDVAEGSIKAEADDCLAVDTKVPLNDEINQPIDNQNPSLSLNSESRNNGAPPEAAFNSNQEYHPAALYSMYASSSMYNMPYMQQQALYYQSIAPHFPYALWPPPPPPPPPPPDEEDTSCQLSVQENLVNSESLPSSETHQSLSSSLIQPCNHVQEVFSTQVQNSPSVFDPSLSTASQVPSQPVPSSISRDDTPAKKKKKKKSKKKKKKHKRKRSHADSDVYSSASSEYCVEYCSTLVNYEEAETAGSSRLDVESRSSTSLPLSADVPEAQESRNSNLNPSPKVKEDSQLLLKIDKTKISFNSADSNQHSRVSSAEDEISDASEKNQEKPMVTPLKLKLCGLKSDRTLRGGLVAREYQILDPDPSNVTEITPDTESPSITSLSKSTDCPSSSKSRAKKSKTSKSAKVALSNRSATKKSPSNLKVTSATTTSDSPVTLPACKVATTLQSLSQTLPGSVTTSRPGLQPEQHWKKRKLHVHEASVTIDEKLQMQPKKDQQSPAVNQSLTSSTTSKAVPVEAKTSLDKKTIKSSNNTLSSFTTSKDPSSSKQNQHRRKKTNDPGKSEKNPARSAQGARSPMSLYKFTVSNTHQKKVAAAGRVNEQSAATNQPDKDKTPEALNSISVRSEEDPYDFSDFDET